MKIFPFLLISCCLLSSAQEYAADGAASGKTRKARVPKRGAANPRVLSTAPEQTHQLGLFGKLLDSTRFLATDNDESYFMRHAGENTLQSVYPTGIDKRSAAAKALVHVVGRMQTNLYKDYTVRLGNIFLQTKRHSIPISTTELDAVEEQLKQREADIAETRALLEEARAATSGVPGASRTKKRAASAAPGDTKETLMHAVAASADGAGAHAEEVVAAATADPASPDSDLLAGDEVDSDIEGDDDTCE